MLQPRRYETQTVPKSLLIRKKSLNESMAGPHLLFFQRCTHPQIRPGVGKEAWHKK
jgi:hypothetical protein